MSQIALQALDLSSIRGERTLFTGLNLRLDRGQCLHLVGSNGSGKTTLLRIIAGINRADSGSVKWDGKSAFDNPDYLRKSAYLGHFDGLKNELTAAENLAFYQQLEGTHSPSQVDHDLNRMGILRCADLATNKLSFGQRRRLAFARLLSGGYVLWILDEPFTGIDQQGRALIEGICADHLANHGIILLTNHQSLKHCSLAPYLIEHSLDSAYE